MNLPRSKDRLDNFRHYYDNMKTKKPPMTVVEAVDGNAMKDTELFKKWPGLTDKHTGYKGLQMSNVKCLELASQQKPSLDWVIICEDDAELPANIDFYKIIETYHDSKVIYLDNRNPKGHGVVPAGCMCCVMYHKSVFADMIKELHPDTSTHIAEYKPTTGLDTLFDWYMAWLIKHRFNIPCSSHPIVPNGRFKSTVS
tara:strand:- start:321 stop:914 length:594 start_codon:yes stop_codon:yes gene_type:complete